MPKTAGKLGIYAVVVVIVVLVVALGLLVIRGGAVGDVAGSSPGGSDINPGGAMILAGTPSPGESAATPNDYNPGGAMIPAGTPGATPTPEGR